MQAALEEVNPFALMLDPEAVVQAMERCESLNQLKRRICRPLDLDRDDEDSERPVATFVVPELAG
jgi:hypothetical protein